MCRRNSDRKIIFPFGNRRNEMLDCDRKMAEYKNSQQEGQRMFSIWKYPVLWNDLIGQNKLKTGKRSEAWL